MANKCKRGILISKTPYEKRIAIMEDGDLADIYKGVVQKVLPALKAAFIDIGLEKAGFLHQDDAMDRNESLRREYGDDDDEGGSSKEVSIDEILKEGQEIMVQVVKEPISTKGARLTTHLSFAGRFLVCMPGTNFIGSKSASRCANSRASGNRRSTTSRPCLPKRASTRNPIPSSRLFANTSARTRTTCISTTATNTLPSVITSRCFLRTSSTR